MSIAACLRLPLQFPIPSPLSPFFFHSQSPTRLPSLHILSRFSTSFFLSLSLTTTTKTTTTTTTSTLSYDQNQTKTEDKKPPRYIPISLYWLVSCCMIVGVFGGLEWWRIEAAKCRSSSNTSNFYFFEFFHFPDIYHFSRIFNVFLLFVFFLL